MRTAPEDEPTLLDLWFARELVREEIAGQQDPLHYEEEDWDE